MRKCPGTRRLNESPSEKEGKSSGNTEHTQRLTASMKVPPKRKGNHANAGRGQDNVGLNESPSEKEGKFGQYRGPFPGRRCLNESPSEKEGKSALLEGRVGASVQASMKVPPKRKGNYS